jgi:uncharacterized protein
LAAGVNAIIAATRHEYKGTGKTVYEQKHNGGGIDRSTLILFIVIAFIVLRVLFSSRSRGIGWVMSSGGWGGFSGGGGGGFSGGGGGGFSSGGGGSFGGGGAGSSW